MIGGSPAINELKEQIDIVAPTSGWVLITGENGTGKELVARAIHTLSQRGDKPFIEVNCAAIPEELIESELFGHEKGSFTGATALRQGKFDLANEGTLFLDEIGDMSLKTQAKVLRILQERKFERVGGSRTIEVDVRVIAATNKDLEEEIGRAISARTSSTDSMSSPSTSRPCASEKKTFPADQTFSGQFLRQRKPEIKTVPLTRPPKP